jgi:hypothetical protein
LEKDFIKKSEVGCMETGPAQDMFNGQRRRHSKKASNAIERSAEREMNTVKFWLEPALLGNLFSRIAN